MTKRVEQVERSWRRTVWFLRLFPFWIALIVGFNIWDDRQKGHPVNWMNLWIGAGFLALTGFLAIWMWLIYRFVRRYSEHKDRNSQ